jgi:heat shock protein HslJ
MRLLFAAAVFSFALVSVAHADGVMSLAGSEWGEGIASGPADVMVKFEQGNKVWGRLGCNRFTGTYSQNDYGLSFGPLATTRMACPEPQMKTEQRVSAALAATREADISHLKLVLKDGAGTALLTLQRRDFD